MWTTHRRWRVAKERRCSSTTSVCSGARGSRRRTSPQEMLRNVPVRICDTRHHRSLQHGLKKLLDLIHALNQLAQGVFAGYFFVQRSPYSMTSISSSPTSSSISRATIVSRGAACDEAVKKKFLSRGTEVSRRTKPRRRRHVDERTSITCKK